MSELRKPVLVFMLKRPGKKSWKCELFDASAFRQRPRDGKTARRYRVRVNGRWYGEKGKGKAKTYFTRWEFRDILWKSITWP